MEITESQKKYIILALSILCAAMLLLIISTVIGRAGKTAVSFVVSPDETQIEFNNQKITGSRTVYLKPGEYSFKATRDGFRENTIQTTIKDKPIRIVFALAPTGKVSKSEKSTNASKIDKITTEALEKEQTKLAEANPVIKKLPIKNFIYSIGYRADSSKENSIIVEIDAPKGYKNAAVNEIRKAGFDPSKLNINFRDYANPFTE
jgi:hypothetical protein